MKQVFTYTTGFAMQIFANHIK